MRILIALLAFAVPLSSDPSQTTEDDLIYRLPTESKRCIVEGSFSCQEYEYIRSVQGVRCVEDCLVLSNLNKCKLSNRCVWDPGSGCFRKTVCDEISNLENCRRWIEEVICK